MAFQEQSVTWQNGASASDAIALGDFKMIAIIFPSTMSGNGEVADIQMQDDAGNWYDVYNSAGTKLTLTITQAVAVGIDANLLELAPASFIRIDNTGGTAEAAERSLKVKVKS